jgi:hypothetical protein
MIIFSIAALLVLPLVVLRRATLLHFYGTVAGTWLFAWILARRLPALDSYAGGVAVAVITLAIFSLFVAAGREVKWSAGRAALVAAIVYALAIPAMLRAPIDGDEPFYLLVTESIVHDRDLDLANQYRTLERTASGRTDLVPQFGDPVGARGEQYSRHEPFLPFLMVPGFLVGGLYGAVATIALFGALLVRSTIRWMEDEGIPDAAARAVFPFFAFAPPVLFYATRIWPEVPAAFFFVEALRGVRSRRISRWAPALLGLVLLKLRFVLVAMGLFAAVLVRYRRRWPVAIVVAVIAGIVAVPLAIMWLISGDPTSVHSWRDVIPSPGMAHLNAFFGLLVDGMSGIAFQAPFYLLGLFALTQWRAREGVTSGEGRAVVPEGFRLGILASLIYLFYLLPRSEWFGGWAPPLRYVVFLMPVLALGAAAVWDRISRAAIALVALWTMGLVIHGVAYPWRLFHIANGENVLGEWLSRLYQADVSRFFPSFIRPNPAAWIGAAVVVIIVVVGVRRYSARLSDGRDMVAPVLVALAIAWGFQHLGEPAARVEIEDAHVVSDGAELYPEMYTLMRFAYRGGRILEEGAAVSFLARAGTWRLHYITGIGATIDIDGRVYELPPGERYETVLVTVPENGRITLRCVRGAVNIDRMELHE